MTNDTGHSWSIDAIEEGIARIEEDGARMLTVPSHLLPVAATAGQLLRVTRTAGQSTDAVVITIAVDHAGTSAALEKSARTTAEAMKHSAKRDPGGNVTL